MFDLNKYLGTWYELAHYPSWFQRNDNYNTRAEYSLNKDGSMAIVNSTINRGTPVASYGKATKLRDRSFKVEFSNEEATRLQTSPGFQTGPVQGWESQTPGQEWKKTLSRGPSFSNYVVDKIWYDAQGRYLFAVVTDDAKESMWVLSRFKNPSLGQYNQVIKYVTDNYDRNKLVQTPHFE